MISPSVVHIDDLAYDYTKIADPALRTLAQRAAEEIKPRLRRATEDILTIGNRLATVRQYLPHGQWMDWLDTEFEMGDETARHFINVATRFSDKYQKFGNLKPSALYALAAPSTPDDAIVEVQARIANGHIPTVAQTKTIIAEVRAGLVPAPAEPQASASATPAKLLVDWTDDDWAAHQAQIETAESNAVADIAERNNARFEGVKIAREWLSNYRSKGGLAWHHLTENQITHANSPCYAAFIAAYPGIHNPKLILASALFDVTLASRNKSTQPPAVVRPSSVVSPPSDNIELSPGTGEPRALPLAANRLAVHYSSDNAEHYTPDPIWQAAQKLMGSIDLDPCSNSHEQPNIPATRHYTIVDDGLYQLWTGNVYMNPPYGPAIGDWITKLVEAHTAGDVPQAIALIPARIDTKWWQLIRDYPVCFVTGRLTFKGNDSGAPFPSAIVYLGQRVDQFVKEFAPIGDIWRRIQ